MTKNRTASSSRAKDLPVQKRVLVLSSSEALDFASAVKTVLEESSKGVIEATVWNHVEGSSWVLTTVLQMIRKFPFVVVVLTGDDYIVYRSEEQFAPRDNLLLELGIALATNDIDHTFIIHPNDAKLKLPTDIDGVLRFPYVTRDDENLKAQVQDPCAKIAGLVSKHKSIMSWESFFEEIKNLDHHINEDSDRLQPHVVIGVNHGGLIAGGLLYFLNRQKWHFLTLWVKDESRYRGLLFRQADFEVELSEVLKSVHERGEEPRILLVDDSDKSGESMKKALDLVRRISGPEAKIRTSAIVYVGGDGSRPTYAGRFAYDRFKYGPV